MYDVICDYGSLAVSALKQNISYNIVSHQYFPVHRVVEGVRVKNFTCSERMNLPDLHLDVGHGCVMYDAQFLSVGCVDIFGHIAVGRLDSPRIIGTIVFYHDDAARLVE